MYEGWEMFVISSILYCKDRRFHNEKDFGSDTRSRSGVGLRPRSMQEERTATRPASPSGSAGNRSCTGNASRNGHAEDGAEGCRSGQREREVVRGEDLGRG